MTNLKDLMTAAQIALPVNAENHPSDEGRITQADGDILIYSDGGLNEDEARYIAALLNEAPRLMEDLATLNRKNLELTRVNAEQRLQEQRLEVALQRAGSQHQEIERLRKLCHETARQARAGALQEAEKAAASVGRPVGAGDGCGTYIPGTSADAARAILAASIKEPK